MVYRKPFTPAQREKARDEYRSFRKNLRELGDAFPPRTLAEKLALNHYRDCIANIKDVLADVDRHIRINELNEATYRAQFAMTEYLHLWYQ